MLIEATKEKLDEVKEALYEIAVNPAQSCYPLFLDGIKSRYDFYEHLENGIAKENHTALFYVENKKVLGLILFFVIPTDNYLQLDGCYLLQSLETALIELLSYIDTHHAGYELYFGFSDRNKEACSVLKRQGFSLIEDDNHDILVFSEYEPLPCSEAIRRLDADTFDDFNKLHQVDDTMYWNSNRIFEHLSERRLYAWYENEEAVAAIYEAYGEIFGVDFKDNVFQAEQFKKLVIKVLNELKSSGHTYVTFFNEDKSQSAALALGFRFVGRYQLYHKVSDLS